MTELAATATGRTHGDGTDGAAAVERLRDALRAAAAGDSDVRLPEDAPGGDEPELRLAAGYAHRAGGGGRPDRFRFGEGLVAQAALEGRTIVDIDALLALMRVRLQR
jgi:hypothetical protein